MPQRKGSLFGLLVTLFLLLEDGVKGLSYGSTCYCPNSHSKSSSTSTGSSTLWSSIGGGYEMEEETSAKVSSVVDNPTETMASFMTTPPSNPKPKVVVLGATGRIGRRIVKRLMDVDIDMEVVAFVRDYNKACEVLYDDGVLIQREGDGKGPRLRLVVGNLISDQEVFGYTPDEEDDDEDEEDDDTNYAPTISAARFYGNDVSEYLLPKDEAEDEMLNDPNEALKEAISDATVIISAVGTIRPTNLWTDFLIAPWRIFCSPANWCTDRTHPYYVNNYAQTKLIAYAEKEQLKRQFAWDSFYQDQLDMQEEAKARGCYYETHMDKESNDNDNSPRIRFIRISDLCVAQPTFGIVTVLTNIARSLVLREQYRGEQFILQQAKHIDTIILRPGDLTDEERNVNTTSLQVSCDGVLPQPALVGRDDAAALVVSAAFTKLDFESARNTRKTSTYRNNRPPMKKRNQIRKKTNGANDLKQDTKHFTIAVRWATDRLMQGTKKDGKPDAQSCMNYVVKEEARKTKHLRLMNAIRNASPSGRLLTPYFTMISKKVMPFRPYSFFVALPVYTMLTSFCLSLWKVVPGKKNHHHFVKSIHETNTIDTIPVHESIRIEPSTRWDYISKVACFVTRSIYFLTKVFNNKIKSVQ